MMVEVVVLAFILMGGGFVLQQNYFDYMLRKEELKDQGNHSEEIAKLLEEFQVYKKRVDSLTVKAGFKL